MRRRIGLFLVTGMLLPLAVAAEASAQGATLTVTAPSTGQATPGQVITVTGTGFNPTNAHVGGVDIRLNTRDSEPLANTNPTPQGTITAEFPLPQAASLPPGEHLLIGTQVTTRGRHTFGTPGRTKLRIVAGTRGEEASAAGFPGDVPPAALAGILALVALTGTVVFCARRLRTLDRPLGS